MMMMSQAVRDTLQKHLQPKKCACVLVPTQRQVILTAQVLKERVMNSSNPKVWLQYEAKQDTKHRFGCSMKRNRIQNTGLAAV
jgi:hypothetical protein